MGKFNLILIIIITRAMKLKEILTPSLLDFRKPSCPLITVSADSESCQEILAKGWLTQAQMHHAAKRYLLGKSRSGKTIYWMVDKQGRVRDGHIGTAWVSQMLRAREPGLLRDWQVRHCLFGSHLAGGRNIAVVESEKSAVILSELLPEHTWLATVYPANLTPENLMSLQDCSVTLFPHTDTTMSNYVNHLEFARLMKDCYGMDVEVSPVLEDHATPEQKQRGVDLLGYLLDGP